MNKHQKLEHARMMGPVAYAEALTEFSMNEDSRGTIVRLLGMNQKWASFFQQKLGKFSFPFAKICLVLSKAAYGTNIFKTDPNEAPVGLPSSKNWSQEARERLEPYLYSLPKEEAAIITLFLEKNGNNSLLLDPWEPFKSALDAFKSSPQLVDTLNKTQNLDRETLTTILDNTRDTINKNQNLSDLGKPVLQLAGGYVWHNVSDDDFCGFGDALGNCGEPTGETMYVLLDKAGRAHVAASYTDDGLDQIVGYGNSIPKQKYKPMVMALANHLGTGLARGEKSWGVSYGTDVHETQLVEFLTDISADRKEAIQMLSDVVSDNWDLLSARGVDPEGLEYLGTGMNGTAWQMRDGRILKITTDDAEAHVASALRGKKFKRVFTIFDVWAFPQPINGHHIYGLVTEGGLQKLSEAEEAEIDQLSAVLYQVQDDTSTPIEDNFTNTLRYMMADPDLDPREKAAALRTIKKYNIPELMAEMKRIGFTPDFHSGNVMKRPDGTLVVIDIGTGGDQEDSKPPFIEGHLDLDDRLDEVGILGAPQAGSGSQMRNMGSTAWSGGKLVLADPKDHVPVDEEDEEAQFLDQDRKGLGPAGSNSPY